MSESDRYRLEPVRSARSRDERIRRGDLATAATTARASQDQLDGAAARADAKRTALEAARSVARELAATGTTSATLARAERFVTRLRRDHEAALDEVARLRGRHQGHLDGVEAARGGLARARADKQIIERHFERWREHRHKLAERRED